MRLQNHIEQVINTLGPYTANLKTALDPLVALRNGDPFRALISTILTAQTKDQVSAPVSKNLFDTIGDKPIDFVNITQEELEELIFRVSYYKTKAKHIILTAKIIHETHNDVVPHTYDELIQLPGVGPKTANLLLGEVFHIPAICVDIHVHRISNRLGIIQTNTREKSLKSLEKVLPIKYWIQYNNILVKMGQTICKPVSPFCSTCPAKEFCPKIGVTSRR